MKVLHVFISLPVGGAEDLVLSVMRAAPPTDRPEVVCLRELGATGREAERNGLPVRLLSVAPHRSMSLFGLWKLSRWLRASNIAVVHTHVYNAHVYGVLAAWLAGIPSVMHHHKTFNRSRRRRWWIMRLLAKLAAVQVTLSEQTRKDIISELRVPPARVVVVPNAVDSTVFHPAQDRAAIRRQVGLRESSSIIGGVASLTPQKNHSATVAACAELVRRGVQFEAILCGEGMMRPVLEEAIAAKHLQGTIRLVGNQRPLPPWMQSFDVMVLPSTWEGQPLVLLQALACQVPIVASRIEGNIALLGSDHPGLFQTDNLDEYANLVEKVLTEDAFRQNILEYQSRILAAQPSLTEMIANLDKVYRTVALATGRKSG
ncbi:MAG: glycosyltransferase [Verrucomicrobia bacterium]|nr:glycosyltransferase [Verrucomicrobiota bacterium]